MTGLCSVRSRCWETGSPDNAHLPVGCADCWCGWRSYHPEIDVERDICGGRRVAVAELSQCNGSYVCSSRMGPVMSWRSVLCLVAARFTMGLQFHSDERSSRFGDQRDDRLSSVRPRPRRERNTTGRAGHSQQAGPDHHVMTNARHLQVACGLGRRRLQEAALRIRLSGCPESAMGTVAEPDTETA
jgi:hypothetical protein